LAAAIFSKASIFHLFKVLACFMSIKEVVFLEGRLYLANQRNLKSFQKVLIGWKKFSPSKSYFVFGDVNRQRVRQRFNNENGPKVWA